MNTINTICTVLTVVFVFGLFLLVIQIIYVLWRRRSLHGRNLSISAGAQFSDDSFFSPQQPSKELLYFFCWKNQASRIEPAATAPPLPVVSPPSEADVEEMLKWNGIYGPPRGLFTIREEEREEIIEASQVGGNNNVNVVVTIADVEERDETTRSDVVLHEEVDGFVVDVEVLGGVDEATPFDTPCGSPPYYTPSPSPPRNDVVLSEVNINMLSFSVESDSSEKFNSGMPEKLTAGV